MAVMGDYMRLPASVQEIADVIGRERALFLVGQLPRAVYLDGRYAGATRAQVIMYVPKRWGPKLDHELIRILGWHDAERLRVAFGGEILKPAVCTELYRPFRDEGIRRAWAAGGVTVALLAQWFGVHERTVRSVLAGGQATEEIPQEGIRAANDDSAPTTNTRAA